MAITQFSQWSTTAALNVDLNNIPLDSAVMTASQVDDAIRELMKQLKAGVAPLAAPAFTTSIQLGSGAVITALDFGVYTPTLTNTTNVASSSGSAVTKWSRTGTIVTVSGQLSIDPTLAAPTDTVLEISLPVASNIDAATRISGIATEPTSSRQVATITGSVANDTAVLSFSASDGSPKTWQFMFMYQVL